jgi:hypothetical protein
MKTISMMMLVGAVMFGGCGADQTCPAPTMTVRTEVKHFVRVNATMDYFEAQAACADLHGTLARAVGTAEQHQVLRACRPDAADAVCWTGYATPEAVFSYYQADTLAYPVCQVWY